MIAASRALLLLAAGLCAWMAIDVVRADQTYYDSSWSLWFLLPPMVLLLAAAVTLGRDRRRGLLLAWSGIAILSSVSVIQMSRYMGSLAVVGIAGIALLAGIMPLLPRRVAPIATAIYLALAFAAEKYSFQGEVDWWEYPVGLGWPLALGYFIPFFWIAALFAAVVLLIAAIDPWLRRVYAPPTGSG